MGFILCCVALLKAGLIYYHYYQGSKEGGGSLCSDPFWMKKYDVEHTFLISTHHSDQGYDWKSIYRELSLLFNLVWLCAVSAGNF